MHLESKIVIFRDPGQVGAYLGDISNVAKWDRGVADAVQTSSMAGNGVGAEFYTLAHGDKADDPHARGRMSYRVVEVGTDYSVVELTNSTGNARFFKEARWTFRLHPDPKGTLLTCSADFKLRSWYILLAPLFYSMNSAICKDLEHLKQVLEKTLCTDSLA